MKALVVYYSKFGHTQMVAEAIANELTRIYQSKSSHGDPVHIMSFQNAEPDSFNGLDLLVMGTPTHNMNLPKDICHLFDQLPRKCLKGSAFAVFDTSYQLSNFLGRFTASKRLSRKLKKSGGRRLLLPETFIVLDREGPLADGELERAATWAGEIASRFNLS
jgi:flavodoxin